MLFYYMYSKITYKRKKNKHNKTNKNKRGGLLNWFRKNKSTILSQTDCDPNNLTNLKNISELKDNYKKCCPKSFLGFKNSSPYCKQLQLNADAINEQNKYKGLAGYSEDELQELDINGTIADIYNDQKPKKSWWKFYGGTNKNIKKHRRRTNKNYKLSS